MAEPHTVVQLPQVAYELKIKAIFFPLILKILHHATTIFLYLNSRITNQNKMYLKQQNLPSGNRIKSQTEGKRTNQGEE